MWRLFLSITFASFLSYSIEEDCLKYGISTQCCADFYMKEKKCIPCPRGYFGLDCSYMCPYPTYGRRCLDGKCTCPKEYCNAKTGCGTQKIINSNLNGHKIQHNGEVSNAKKSESSSTVVAVISIVLTLIILSLVMVIVFRKINIRQQLFSSKRGSRVASQRNATTYYEIDEKKMEENELNNKCPEPEIYESIDQSKKDATKYTELPTRPGVSKQERKLMSTITMHKILDDASDYKKDEDDDDKCNGDRKSKVRMRKDKVHHADILKRMGTCKTSTKISGYIEMGKKIPEEYVSMTTEKLDI